MNFFQSLTSLKNYQRLSFITPFVVFILMIFGSYVKAIGAGLACPDWPLCHGQLIPLYVAGDPVLWVYMEYIHRLIVLAVTFLVICIVICSFIYRQLSPRLYPITFLMVILLIIQIILGGLTIDTFLNPVVVTTHFTVATTIFALSIIHAMLASYDLSASKIQQVLKSTNSYKEKMETANIEIQ